MKLSETMLVRQLQEGNESAYKYLYEHHYVVLCHIAENYVKDRFIAETIVGDVIFHIWEIRESLVITENLRKYLICSVRNRCLNYLKAESYKKEAALSLFADVELFNNILVDDSHPLGILLEHELEDKIQEVVTRLPKDCQRVFVKSRFENKSYEEISLELNISVNTVKYHIKNALAFLNKHLSEYLISFFYFFLIQN